MNQCYTPIPWKRDTLWRGCILAGLAHAIMTAHYPELANEHSWDGFNYSVQDSQGQRGTVTFGSKYCVAAFRNDNSERAAKPLKSDSFFQGAPQGVIDLANEEALQYLLDQAEGEIRPVITAAFWGADTLVSSDTFEDILSNGGELLEYHMLDHQASIEAWEEYYEMNKNQLMLLESVYERKIAAPDAPIILKKKEILLIGPADEQGLEESRTSFEEMGIVWT